MALVGAATTTTFTIKLNAVERLITKLHALPLTTIVKLTRGTPATVAARRVALKAVHLVEGAGSAPSL